MTKTTLVIFFGIGLVAVYFLPNVTFPSPELRFPERITQLTVGHAEVLAQRVGDLHLDALRTISQDVATALSHHQGAISFNSLTSLSDEAAESLSQQKGALSLNGLTSLSDKAAEAFAQHNGDLSFNGLNSLSDEGAKSLMQHNGQLSLGGLATLSPEVAEAVTKHVGKLVLHGIKTISGDAARRLSRPAGNVELFMDTLSEEAAEALATDDGDIVICLKVMPNGKSRELVQDIGAVSDEFFRAHIIITIRQQLSDRTSEALGRRSPKPLLVDASRSPGPQFRSNQPAFKYPHHPGERLLRKAVRGRR